MLPVLWSSSSHKGVPFVGSEALHMQQAEIADELRKMAGTQRPRAVEVALRRVGKIPEDQLSGTRNRIWTVAFVPPPMHCSKTAIAAGAKESGTGLIAAIGGSLYPMADKRLHDEGELQGWRLPRLSMSLMA